MKSPDGEGYKSKSSSGARNRPSGNLPAARRGVALASVSPTADIRAASSGCLSAIFRVSLVLATAIRAALGEESEGCLGRLTVEIQLASLKREVESLKDSAREIQKEMLLHRRDQTALASDLTALKDLQERLKTQQETLNRAQLQLSDELGEGLSALGASLIAGLKDLLETFAASRAEPKTPTLPPPLPRRRL